jgi:hypothetical protein
MRGQRVGLMDSTLAPGVVMDPGINCLAGT